jgi:hypothetical protein
MFIDSLVEMLLPLLNMNDIFQIEEFQFSVCLAVFSTDCESASLPSICILVKCPMHQDVSEQEKLIQMTQQSPGVSM